ncbi:MAG TPA: Chromate resistance protein ChrB [Nocardioidaceae bacterium]|nr:Chromate resistance protein ChrB [Nocardioidaceae bacterium]
MSTPTWDEWVFLTYSLPREPSTPRLALWRKLKRYGVAQLADGLVALPADARTREQLEWAADDVVAAGGTASVWIARPTTRVQVRDLARSMSEARAAEYAGVLAEAAVVEGLPPTERTRALRRLRGELRRIQRRDYFRPPERERARRALDELARLEAAL